MEGALQRKLGGLEMSQSQERKTSKSSSKYSSWKYPHQLDENALRFFEFSEGERALLGTRKSTLL
jgi:hypothetical protein